MGLDSGGSAIPWQLDIHLVDVGQGDCTLIVADNAALGQTRSMLIDAGHPAYGEIAHNYIVNTAGLNNLHRMVLTHYNEDHGGGLRALLIAPFQVATGYPDNDSSIGVVIGSWWWPTTLSRRRSLAGRPRAPGGTRARWRPSRSGSRSTCTPWARIRSPSRTTGPRQPWTDRPRRDLGGVR